MPVLAEFWPHPNQFKLEQPNLISRAATLSCAGYISTLRAVKLAICSVNMVVPCHSPSLLCLDCEGKEDG